MGFDPMQATEALQNSKNDFDAALTLLTTSATSSLPPPSSINDIVKKAEDKKGDPVVRDRQTV